VIIAYCDHCGDGLDADVKAGCRVLAGNREYSFHLCELHQQEWLDQVQAFLEAHEWRPVKR
jgi:hypothetical protein